MTVVCDTTQVGSYRAGVAVCSTEQFGYYAVTLVSPYQTTNLGSYVVLGVYPYPLQILTIVQNSNFTWTFTWSSTGAGSYRIVLNGTQQAVVTTPTYTTTQPGWETYPPPLEIMQNDGTLAPSEQNIPYLVIQWYYVPCAYFIVNQYISGAWIQKVIIVNDPRITTPWFTWVTPVQADETTALFQVIAVDNLNQQSVPLQYSKYIVRPPTLVETSIDIGYSESSAAIVVSAS